MTTIDRSPQITKGMAEGAAGCSHEISGADHLKDDSKDHQLSPFPTVAVVIASLARPELVGQMSALMMEQTCKPDLLVFSVVSKHDIPVGIHENSTTKIIFGMKGLCSQRNRALDAIVHHYDVIVFYDDDFVPTGNSIGNIKKFFQSHPDVVGATGSVIKDGINGPGISLPEAKEYISSHDRENCHPNCIVTNLEGLYGCNMAYRASAIGSLRFDERLRLYGWQEDVDFASSLSKRGRIVKTFAFSGVHQGIKISRTCGVKLGYSQIINPVYLVKKGTMSRIFASRLILGNLLANHLKCVKAEPWIDRPGRLRGNWIGIIDLFRGRINPERIEDI